MSDSDNPTARVYARVSTADQIQNFSLASQRTRSEAWAIFASIPNVQHYEDAGLSGKRDDRPGLSALLLDLQRGDVVVTASLSRLGRGGAAQLLGIVERIRQAGARLVSLTEAIDTDTPMGRLMLTILAALAEMEIEQTRERTDAGRTQAALEGIYPHSPDSLPTGWTTDEAGRVVESEHAETVRLIFQQGRVPYRQTAELLESLGVAGTRGGGWQSSQVRKIVVFPGYATGELIYRALSSPDSPERHVRIPAPALVTPEVWEAAQRDGRVNNVHKRPDKYPLTGHLRCACGARLAGRHSGPPLDKPHHVRHAQYVCYDHVRKTPTCPTNGKRTRAYRVDTLNAAARAALADLLTNPDDPARLAVAYGAVPASDPHAAERVDTERKLSALLDLYLEGVIDRSTYDARRATFTARLGQLRPLPAPDAPPAMPAAPELAADVLASSNELFAELLDVLDVEFVAEGESVRVVHFKPL